MQKIVIIVFAMTFLLKPALPVLEYFIDYDYITKELCINKDKKNLHCNGRCHLKTKLAEASGTSENAPPDRKQKASPIELLFFLPIPDFQLSGFSGGIEKTGYCYSNLYRFVSTGDFFRPPSLL